jgi:hypothetical protein
MSVLAVTIILLDQITLFQMAVEILVGCHFGTYMYDVAHLHLPKRHRSDLTRRVKMRMTRFSVIRESEASFSFLWEMSAYCSAAVFYN